MSAASLSSSGGDECVLGLSGALFALKVACLARATSVWCVNLVGSCQKLGEGGGEADFVFLFFFCRSPPVLFEVFELLILLEPRTRLLHLSSLLAGLLLYAFWWKGSPRPGAFPGSAGVRLGRAAVDGASSGPPRARTASAPRRRRMGTRREKNWTRSWGYGFRPTDFRSVCVCLCVF